MPCCILFCHLSLDIIETVSAGRQQKAAGKETQFPSEQELVCLKQGAAVISGEDGLQTAFVHSLVFRPGEEGSSAVFNSGAGTLPPVLKMPTGVMGHFLRV